VPRRTAVEAAAGSRQPGSAGPGDTRNALRGEAHRLGSRRQLAHVPVAGEADDDDRYGDEHGRPAARFRDQGARRATREDAPRCRTVPQDS
jgi:hypothetical protein